MAATEARAVPQEAALGGAYQPLAALADAVSSPLIIASGVEGSEEVQAANDLALQLLRLRSIHHRTWRHRRTQRQILDVHLL